MNFKKRYLLPLVLIPILAFAGTIKTWTNGEKVNAADLNANFAHIHNNMVGNHGARLLDADISSSAAISHSKMATPALLPKAWSEQDTICTGASASGTPCTVDESVGITSITSTGSTGVYYVNLSYTPANGHYAIIVQSHNNGATVTRCNAIANGGAGGPFATTNPNFTIQCRTSNGANTLTDSAFSMLIMDR